MNALTAYGFSGELVPVKDPDSAIDVNTLWDNMVTKPIQPTAVATTSAVDFDWDTADTAPDTEPGEIDLNDLFNLVDDTKEIMAPQLEWMSSAKGFPRSIAAGTPDTYTPSSFKTFRSSRRLTADCPSYALLAISSPSLDNQSVTHNTLSGVASWAVMENIKNVMNDMWKMQTGLTEGSAERPYDFISATIGDWLSPNMIDPSSTLLDPMQYTAFCIADWIFDVPDTGIPRVLDAKNG